MRRLLFSFGWMVLLAPLLAGQAGPDSPRRSAAHEPPKYKPWELLVRFRAGTSEATKSAAHNRAAAVVLRTYHIVPGLQRVRVAEGVDILRAARIYRRNPAVLYAEPNYRVHSTVAPNDPLFANGTQWDLNNTGQNGGTAHADIAAEPAWGITTGSSNVVVGIVDTGVDYNHPDLSGNMHALESSCSDGIDNDGNGYVDDCFGINAITGAPDPMDDFGHGTHVAGTIGAKGNNATGIAGINWNVGLVACKFLDSGGSGFTGDAITCLEYFKDLKDNRGLNLVATNNSWGGGGYSQALYDAIDAQRQSGILFIAAAGNSGLDNDALDFFPANFFLPNVIAVAATDRNDALAGFSDFGKHTVSLGAPGVAITSTVPTGGTTISDPSGYASLNGTSMATPHVTGVAALLAAQNPARDWRAIKNLILAGGDTIPSLASTITGKRLNANGALTCSNAIVTSRLRPALDPASVAVGGSLLLAVLNIDCAAPNGDVTVTINPGGITIILKDDGNAPDQVAGDGIYSGTFTPAAPGAYTASLPGGDSFTIVAVNPYFYQPTTHVPRVLSNPTALHFSDDEVATVTPSFPIPFGDGSFSRLYVSNNGVVSFDTSNLAFFNPSLPTTTGNTFVAPFWTDLETFTTGGDVFWEEQGTAPNRELVIEFRDEGLILGCDFYYGCVGSQAGVTFQEVFFESRSDVLFNYNQAEFSSDATFGDYAATATVGIQAATTAANQFSFNQPSVDNNTALLWTTTGPNVAGTAPVIASISPSSASAPADFVLTVNGSNFLSNSVVRWNGVDRPTTYVGPNQLTAQITHLDIASAGLFPVTVFTFTGGNSAPAIFTVVGPAITSLSPASIDVGAPTFSLTVNGSNFDSGSVVLWNGSPRATTFVGATQLTATIDAADVAAGALASVDVLNSGGIAAPPVTFPVVALSLGGLSPNGIGVGSPGLTLSVFGSGFDTASVVRWNGSGRPTTFYAPGLLTAQIPAADLAGVGNASVDVVNPYGVATATANFVISDFNLTSAPAGQTVRAGQPAAFTVTVDRGGFLFSQPIALACSVPSSVGSCALVPDSIAPGSGADTAALTVNTVPTAAALSQHSPWNVYALALALLLPAGLVFTGRRRRILLSGGVALLALLTLVSCGGGSSATTQRRLAQARTVTVTVTATSGSVQHSSNMTLTVQ